MPSSEKRAEEVGLTAQVSAERAANAAVQAEKDDIAAKRVAAGGPVCPNCHGELVKHSDSDPAKAGASHCNSCGTCWAPGLKEVRAGHPVPAGWPKD